MSVSQNGQLDLFSDVHPTAARSSAPLTGDEEGAFAPPRSAGAKPKPKPKPKPNEPEPKTVRKRKPPARHVAEGPARAPKASLPACLSDVAVARRYGVSRPTIWRWTKTVPGFPQPAKISGGTTRWWLTELEAFDRSKMAPPSPSRQRTGKGGAV